jgi:hypothetical protein
MEVENSRLFCIYCRKVVFMPVEDQYQYHINCWKSVNKYKYNNSSKHYYINKISKTVNKIIFLVNVNVYHGVIKNNLGFLGSMSKKTLIYTTLSYFSFLLLFIYLLN